MGDNVLYIRYEHIKRTNESHSLFEILKVLDIEFVIIHDDLLIYNGRYIVLKFPSAQFSDTNKDVMFNQLKKIHNMSSSNTRVDPPSGSCVG